MARARFRSSVVSRKVITAPVTRPASWIGVLLKATGTQVPSRRQNTSSLTRCTWPSRSVE
jgi:hypothetical protein